MTQKVGWPTEISLKNRSFYCKPVIANKKQHKHIAFKAFGFYFKKNYIFSSVGQYESANTMAFDTFPVRAKEGFIKN